ncbi:MAG: hypothetical protein ABW153_17490 [Sedimenticola sp.]
MALAVVAISMSALVKSAGKMPPTRPTWSHAPLPAGWQRTA